MLDKLAFEFISKDEDTLRLYGIAIVLLGFVAGLLDRSRSNGELQRAPYFAFSMLLYLASIAIAFAWLFSLQAAAIGILWLVVGGVMVGIAGIGYLYGVIAVARSRDAFGTERYAFLGIIPLANFVLLLKQSKNDASQNRIRTPSLVCDGLGVIAGFAMMAVAIGLTATFETQSQAMIESADPGKTIEFMLRAQGLEQTLKVMADQAELPVVVDEVTTLSSVEANGTRLRRTFVVALDMAAISDQFRTGIEHSICSYVPFIALLREGASIEEVYVKSDGSPIGTHTITRDRCGQ